MSIGSLIRSFGLEPLTFASADAFLRSGDRAFACLICDVQMPGTSGLSLQRLMDRWPAALPVIIMSAYPDRARQTALDAGAVCDGCVERRPAWVLSREAGRLRAAARVPGAGARTAAAMKSRRRPST